MAGNEHTPDDHLGGRLPLLAPAELSGEQRELYGRIRSSRVAAAQRVGYTAALADGRLIGPFNALLHAPRLSTGMLTWAKAIGEDLDQAGITQQVRETVILTVAASRGSEYAVYAHSAAARHAGLDAAVIDAIIDHRTPEHLPPDAALGHRLARHLADGRAVDDDTYTSAVAAFGVAGLVALVGLIGQYLTTCAVLSCFDVPAPRNQDMPPVNTPALSERNSHAAHHDQPA